MKIAINALSITPQRGGAKTYLTNLVKSLAEIDSSNTYYLILSKLNRELFEDILADNFKKIKFPLFMDSRSLRLIMEQVLIPVYVKKHGIDILYSPGNLATFFPGCSQVVVLQGLLTIKAVRDKYAPGVVSSFQASYYDITMPPSAKRADRVIAVSESIKSYLLNQVPIDESKVNVIHEGASIGWLQDSDLKYEDLPEPYILFLSTLFEYKNADKLVESFGLLKKRYNIPHRLVLVGRDPGDQEKRLEELARENQVEGEIVFTGAVEHKKVASLYKNADVFVYPSSVETFGLPVLEAMACGTPEVASNRMSVPEVAGDAALIVNPDNIEEMAEAIYRVIMDESLRAKLIEKGYERVKQFSWEKAAKETLEVFEEVYNSGR